MKQNMRYEDRCCYMSNQDMYKYDLAVSKAIVATQSMELEAAKKNIVDLNKRLSKYREFVKNVGTIKEAIKDKAHAQSVAINLRNRVEELTKKAEVMESEMKALQKNHPKGLVQQLLKAKDDVIQLEESKDEQRDELNSSMEIIKVEVSTLQLQLKRLQESEIVAVEKVEDDMMNNDDAKHYEEDILLLQNELNAKDKLLKQMSSDLIKSMQKRTKCDKKLSELQEKVKQKEDELTLRNDEMKKVIFQSDERLKDLSEKLAISESEKEILRKEFLEFLQRRRKERGEISNNKKPKQESDRVSKSKQFQPVHPVHTVKTTTIEMGQDMGAIIPSIIELPLHVNYAENENTIKKKDSVNFFLDKGGNIECVPSPLDDPVPFGDFSVEESVKSNWDDSISTHSQF